MIIILIKRLAAKKTFWQQKRDESKKNFLASKKR
jgi:hypothetical protein